MIAAFSTLHYNPHLASIISIKFGNPLTSPPMTSHNQYADRIPKEIRNSRMLMAAIIDNHGRILFYNEMLGSLLNPHTASHLHYSELIHQEDLENFRSALSMALSGKIVSNIITRILSSLEEPDRDVQWEFAPVEDPLGKEHFVMVIGTHLQKSILKKVDDSPEAALITSLMRRNRDLEQFANIVSHNIRSPLANIMGLNKLLNLKLNEADKDMALKGIRVSAEKLEGVIKDLNDVLAVRNSNRSNETEINLVKMVDDIRLSFGEQLSKTQATILCDFESISVITSVKSYVQSIFYNMISNAIKYARPGVPPVIRITTLDAGDNVIISFTDNGIGIDLARHGSNLFGLYKRFNDRVEGKGLGLYMVKAQIEALSGSIEVDSTPGEGTTFTVSLPQ